MDNSALQAELKHITSLIEAKQYAKALERIEEQLSQKQDLNKPEPEQAYKRLLEYRVAVNSFLGKDDELILDVVHRSKYPSEHNYDVEGKGAISIISQSLFQLHCDAYVNTIHKDKLLNLEDKSASQGFIS